MPRYAIATAAKPPRDTLRRHRTLLPALTGDIKRLDRYLAEARARRYPV